MTKQEFINYLKEHLDEMIEEYPQDLDYKDCLDILLAEIKELDN